MKIGISSRVVHGPVWFKAIAKTEFNTIEINRRKNRCFFNPDYLKRIKEQIGDKNLSFHSGTMSIFSDDEFFTETELQVLMGEIHMANYLNVKEIIFHLQKKSFNQKQIKQFKEVIKYARENKVQLIYEGNTLMNAEIIFENLNHFPELEFCLDLGHLNCSLYHKTLNITKDEFLKEISPKLTYLHIHNNKGEFDVHGSLEEGNHDWKDTLDKIDIKKIKKAIIEVRTLMQARKSFKMFKEYLNGNKENIY